MKPEEIADLMAGDQVRVTQTVTTTKVVTVRSNGGQFSVVDTDRNVYEDIEASNEVGWNPHVDRAAKVELVKRAELPKLPQHWPPQVGDIWRAPDGKEFVVLDKCGFYEVGSSLSTNQEKLLKLNPVLAYRKGDVLR